MLTDKITLRIRGYKAGEIQEIIEDVKDMYTKEEGEPEFDKEIPDLILMKYTKYQKMQANNYDFIEKNLVVQTKSSCIPAYVLLEPLLKRLKQTENKRIKLKIPI